MHKTTGSARPALLSADCCLALDCIVAFSGFERGAVRDACTPTRGASHVARISGTAHCYHPELQVHSAGFRAHLTLPCADLANYPFPWRDEKHRRQPWPSGLTLHPAYSLLFNV